MATHGERSDRLEAVFFDQDGVLIDSEGAWDAARRAIVADNGGHWRPEATREVIDAVLAATGLAGTFGATVSGEEVARGKPAPDALAGAAVVIESLEELSPPMLERL
jgi:beta-phosphoglucomutase-like phosphatase (HAD superfamily)